MGGLLRIADFPQHIPMFYGLALASAIESSARTYNNARINVDRELA